MWVLSLLYYCSLGSFGAAPVANGYVPQKTTTNNIILNYIFYSIFTNRKHVLDIYGLWFMVVFSTYVFKGCRRDFQKKSISCHSYLLVITLLTSKSDSLNLKNDAQPFNISVSNFSTCQERFSHPIFHSVKSLFPLIQHATSMCARYLLGQLSNTFIFTY